jgi:hypothetical protein
MRYVLLICTDEKEEATANPDRLGAYGKFGEEMGRRGVLRDGARLRPTTEATTVSVSNGKVMASDGPFAETKEQIGGFYIVDCANGDEAIEVAAKIPGAAHGKIEVRPIWAMGE